MATVDTQDPQCHIDDDNSCDNIVPADDNRNEQTEKKASDVSSDVEEFLSSISNRIEHFNDPKLKQEQQKLKDLLTSYKKLYGKLEEKSARVGAKLKSKRELEQLPEIYAILHPELYRNPREEEKDKLITNFTKRNVSKQNSIVPPRISNPNLFTIYDLRQLEKEKLIRYLSSMPGRFHNVACLHEPKVNKKVRAPTPRQSVVVENVREKEKERLAKIFSSVRPTGKRVRSSIRSQTSSQRPTTSNESKSKQSNGLINEVRPSTSTSQTANDNKDNRKEEMVRLGEYSPLNLKNGDKVRTLFGEGEHETRRKFLLEERHQEYQEHLKRMKEADKIKEKKLLKEMRDLELDDSDEEERACALTEATQTEGDSEVFVSATHVFKDDAVQTELDSPAPKETSPSHKPILYQSPRERLLNELHGTPQCFPTNPYLPTHSDAIDDKYERQLAYAEELRWQIQEKKRLEDERRRKEKEEEELYEKRLREQQEQLKKEFNKEHQNDSWKEQRQAQEEILRKKILEMELESKEMKRLERRRRLTVNETIDDETPPTPRGRREYVTLREKSESVPVSLRNPSNVRPKSPPLPTHSKQVSSRPLPSLGDEERRREFMLKAPLLDADRCNVLSSRCFQAAPVVTSPSSVLPPLSDSHYALLPKDPLLPSKAPRTTSPSYNTTSPSYNTTSPSYKRIAEEILKAPLDAPISSGRREERPKRSSSPVVPSLRGDGILKKNTQLLDDKWKVPPSEGVDIGGGDVVGANSRSILTQLGAFRRQLHKEHFRLQQRLQAQTTP